jgi:hypothetical protein
MKSGIRAILLLQLHPPTGTGLQVPAPLIATLQNALLYNIPLQAYFVTTFANSRGKGCAKTSFPGLSYNRIL